MTDTKKPGIIKKAGQALKKFGAGLLGVVVDLATGLGQTER